MDRSSRSREASRPWGLARVLAPLLVGVVGLVVWALVAGSSWVAPTLLPGPGAVAQRFVADLRNGLLVSHTLTTLLEAVLGCVVATGVALPLGYVIAHNRLVDAGLSPYLAASQALPAVAVAPLLVIWVGYGLLPVVLLCALIVFFPVVLGTVHGLRRVDRDVVDAARLDGAHGVRLLRHIEEPLARPSVLVGLRNGFTLSITGAVVGELVMGGDGLGTVLSAQASAVDTTGVFATLVMLCLLAVALYLVMLVAERVLDPLEPVVLHRGPGGTP